MRFSILNCLEYWRPVDFCSIEIMHNLILGNLKDHATTYLSISTAGLILEKKLEKQKNWKIARKTMVFHLLEPEYENVSIADSLSQGASVNNSHPDSSSASSSGSVSKFSKLSRYSARPNANQTGRDSSSQPGTSSRKRKKMSDIPAEATQACPNSPTEVTIKRTQLSQKESAAVAVTNEVPNPGRSRYNLRSRKPAAIAPSQPAPNPPTARNPPKDPPLPKAASETVSRSYSRSSKSCGKNWNTLESDLSMDE